MKIKALINATAIFAMAMLLSGCNKNSKLEEGAPDYTRVDGKDWMYNHDIQGKEFPGEAAEDTGIDLFYIYPTVCWKATDYSKTHDGFVSIDDEGMRQGADAAFSAKSAFKCSGRTFASYTHVYAPYYRQINMEEGFKYVTDDASLCDYLHKGLAYRDVAAALDYYFTTINPDGERPYIMAAHSQGSALLRVVAEYYFAQDATHKSYLDNMVAIYAIGFGVGKEWAQKVEASAGIKIANDPTSTKVFISWNTEGPDSDGKSMLWPADAIAVNPLTWTTDGVAGPEANTGAWTDKTGKEVRGGLYGAECSSHGTVVCREMPSNEYIDPKMGFGNKGLHTWDYPAYWNNIAENGMQRAAGLINAVQLQVENLDAQVSVTEYAYKMADEAGYTHTAVCAGSTYWVPANAEKVQLTLSNGQTSAQMEAIVANAMREGKIFVDASTITL